MQARGSGLRASHDEYIESFPYRRGKGSCYLTALTSISILVSR